MHLLLCNERMWPVRSLFGGCVHISRQFRGEEDGDPDAERDVLRRTVR
jgi:hypothetical protein